jgi:hypothetical protein
MTFFGTKSIEEQSASSFKGTGECTVTLSVVAFLMARLSQV